MTESRCLDQFLEIYFSFVQIVNRRGFQNIDFDIKYINLGQVLRMLRVLEHRLLNLKIFGKTVKYSFSIIFSVLSYV